MSGRLGPGAERVEAWLQANPGGKAWEDDDGWRGTVPVDGERWLLAGPCAGPGDLADVLELRNADAAAVRVIEAEHPGWLARRWSDGTWGAVYPLGPDAVPLHVTADGAGRAARGDPRDRGDRPVIPAATLRRVELQRAMCAADLLAEAHPGAIVKPAELRGRPGGHERYGLVAEVPGASVAGDYGEVRAWLESQARP